MRTTWPGCVGQAWRLNPSPGTSRSPTATLGAGGQHPQGRITYGGHSVPPQPTVSGQGRRRRGGICCCSSHSSSSPAGLGSLSCSSHPTRAPGRSSAREERQNFAQRCRTLPQWLSHPGAELAPCKTAPKQPGGHRAAPRPRFSPGSEAGLGRAEKPPSLVVKIQQIKLVPGEGTSQVFSAGLYHFLLLKMRDPLPVPPAFLKPLCSANDRMAASQRDPARRGRSKGAEPAQSPCCSPSRPPRSAGR